MSAKRTTSYSGAVLRMQRDERLAAADPATQARQHEASFLRAMSTAKADFDWLVANEGWVQLGFSTFADWWETRVAPVAGSLGLRPTKEIARTVIEKVAEEQKSLPKAQQRTQREIAALVGVDRSTVARSTPGANARRGDLDEPVADPLDSFPDAKRAIEEDLAKAAGFADPPVGEAGEDHPTPPSGDAAEPSSHSADELGDEAEEETSDSSTAAQPETQASAGVSSPASPVTGLVGTPIGPMPRDFAEKLDRLVPDPNPHRDWQKVFLDDVFTARRLIRKYSAEEIAEKADLQLLGEFANLAADCDEKQRDVAKAQIARSNAKVYKLRSVQ